jgi:hypothetical protein
MKDHHRRIPATMSKEEKERLIVELRRRRWTYEKIGKQVGMSKNGVMQLLRRVTNPEKYYAKLDEEVDEEERDDERW